MRLLTLLSLTILPLHASIFRVDSTATGANDGSSWADAFHNLEDALRSRDSDGPPEIWVAAGIYYPDEGGSQIEDGKFSNFHTKSDLVLLGGFSGVETSADQRDPAANPTILSGDIEQNDHDPDGDGLILNAEDRVGVNSQSVIFFSSGVENALIDGFVFTAGLVTVSSFNATGTVSNCRFVGGELGVACNNSTLMIRDCEFSFLYGQDVNCGRNSTTTIENCQFIDGKGPYIFTSSSSISTDIVNCRFEKPEYPGSGRGRFIEHRGDGTLTVRSSLFIGTPLVSVTESMIRVDSPSATGIFNCTFAGGNLPAIVNTEESPGALTFTNNIVWGAADSPQINHPSATITHSLIRNESPAGVGNLNGLAAQSDPRFVDPASGDYRLAEGSPAVDVGDNSAVVEARDLAGAPRIIAIVNLGAFEVPIKPFPQIANLIYDDSSQTVTLALSFYPVDALRIESSPDMVTWNLLAFSNSNPVGNSIFTFPALTGHTFYRLVATE